MRLDDKNKIIYNDTLYNSDTYKFFFFNLSYMNDIVKIIVFLCNASIFLTFLVNNS